MRASNLFGLAAVLGVLFASPALSDDWVYRNGKILQVESLGAPVPVASQKASPFKQSRDRDDMIKAFEDLNTGHDHALTLVKSAGNLLTYLTDADRISTAEAEAERIAREARAEHPGKVVAVPIFANREASIEEGDVETAAQIEARLYTVGKPRVYDSQDEMMRQAMGPLRDEIDAANGGSTESPGHLARVVSARANGDVGPISSSEVLNFETAEAKRFEDEAAKQAEQAKLAEDAAAKKAEQAQKDADAAKAKAADEERARAEQEKREADQRAQAARASREEFERLQHERDQACRAGTSNACVLANDKLMYESDIRERQMATALCMTDSEGGAPMGGPCAKGAPPCMNCHIVSDLMRQDISERIAGNSIFAASLSARDGHLQDSELMARLNKAFGEGSGDPGGRHGSR